MTEQEIIFLPRGAQMRTLTGRDPIAYDRAPARVGRWTILSHEGQYSIDQKNLYWPCKCDCGTERMVAATNLRSGKSQSCGCLRTETVKRRLTTHGLSRTKEYRRHYNLCHWSKYLVLKVKASAKKLNLPFNLVEADLSVPEYCPVLGIPLQPALKGLSSNTPTVDRIIPEKGYVKGNVAVVSWRANRL